MLQQAVFDSKRNPATCPRKHMQVSHSSPKFELCMIANFNGKPLLVKYQIERGNQNPESKVYNSVSCSVLKLATSEDL